MHTCEKFTVPASLFRFLGLTVLPYIISREDNVPIISTSMYSWAITREYDVNPKVLL